MASRRPRRPAGAVAWIAAVVLATAACERGCGWGWLRERGLVSSPVPRTAGRSPTGAVDCPDGLARCEDGVVSASRLAALPQPCRGPEAACACPWEQVGACERGCVAEGLVVVVDPGAAMAQLCAAPPDAAPSFRAVDDIRPAWCEEEQLYRCAGGLVTDCGAHAVVASCVRRCIAEDAWIERGAARVGREAAFAILCSR
ncbi:MAG TPA: hypothetical protein VE987_18175 [Polyangiaceae bacterium]|nr:hypothetical protein [Polyangiaceae bacterium]